MNLKFLFLLTFIYAFGSFSFAQNKKDIKKYKIKSVTEFATVMKNGKEMSYKLSYTAYNKSGKVIEDTEFNEDGTIKRKETTKYDSNNNIIEETYFSQKETKESKNNSERKGILNIKTLCSYNVNNDKTEENEYDCTNGKLMQKQVYSYDNKGNKNVEETFNPENKLIKKVICTYNNKGLKTEKRFFDGNDILEMTKKYTYEF